MKCLVFDSLRKSKIYRELCSFGYISVGSTGTSISIYRSILSVGGFKRGKCLEVHGVLIV